MNTFGVLTQICGLSTHDAAQYLKVPPRVALRWSRGVGEATPDALAALGSLQARQQDVADAIISSWDEAGRPPSISLSVARDDDEARSMGWPSLASQIAPAAIAQAILAPIRIELDQGAEEKAAPAALAAV